MTTNEQLIEEFYKRFSKSECSEIELDWWLSKLSQAVKEAVEECQKEMYKSLDEVAQYDKVFGDVKLVNKEDIKVWIHSLSNLHPHSKDEK